MTYIQLSYALHASLSSLPPSTCREIIFLCMHGNLAGHHCNFIETATSNMLLQNCASEEEYTRSLQLMCDEEKEEVILEWTPDENTPDLVYYQVIRS